MPKRDNACFENNFGRLDCFGAELVECFLVHEHQIHRRGGVVWPVHLQKRGAFAIRCVTEISQQTHPSGAITTTDYKIKIESASRQPVNYDCMSAAKDT